jgi:tRNA threonylcarbamoyladenosine biosynthesis protein TsaE
MRTASESETFQAGRDLSAGLRAGDTVLLDGDLGTGKTVFARGVAAGLGVDPRSVHSPTFTLVNVYAGRLPVYHIDLFRIEKPEDLRELGLEDVIGTDGVALVEWPGRLGRYRPGRAIHVTLRDGGGERREITVERPAS